jgi:hypothetical protein
MSILQFDSNFIDNGEYIYDDEKSLKERFSSDYKLTLTECVNEARLAIDQDPSNYTFSQLVNDHRAAHIQNSLTRDLQATFEQLNFSDTEYLNNCVKKRMGLKLLNKLGESIPELSRKFIPKQEYIKRTTEENYDKVIAQAKILKLNSDYNHGLNNVKAYLGEMFSTLKPNHLLANGDVNMKVWDERLKFEDREIKLLLGDTSLYQRKINAQISLEKINIDFAHIMEQTNSLLRSNRNAFSNYGYSSVFRLFMEMYDQNPMSKEEAHNSIINIRGGLFVNDLQNLGEQYQSLKELVGINRDNLNVYLGRMFAIPEVINDISWGRAGRPALDKFYEDR